MSSTWALDVETDIFTIIKTRATSLLNTKYPNIFFTTNDVITSDPVFPTIYIHFLPSTEQGKDIEGTEVNAIYCSLQIDVTVNNEQYNSGSEREIVGVLMDELKKLAFEITSFPEYIGNTESTKRMVLRAARTIGQGNKL